MRCLLSLKKILKGVLLAAVFFYVTQMVYVSKDRITVVPRTELKSHLKVIDDIPDSIKVTRICSQRERIAHLKRFCRENYPQPAKAAAKRPSKKLTKGLSKSRATKYLAGRSLVDHKHRLAYCGISKAGSTMLKSLILEANGLNLTKTKSRDPLYFVHTPHSINRYGVQLMSQVRGVSRQSVLENYFHAISIRHPFDRIVSYYRDKILQDDRSARHHVRVRYILRELRPHLFVNNESLAAARWPQDVLGPPTFNEFVTYIVRHKEIEEHWVPISRVCHPCLLDWGAILRVETMPIDGVIFLSALNRSRFDLPVRHSHASTQPTTYFRKRLTEYGTLTDRSVIDYFLELYRQDMAMFGYGWHNETNTAYCHIDTEDGRCC